jgi:poly-gamma-glutamate capsule biosynthesis protein CapA/YwtB (metallophosphatase superfamily)
MTMGIRLALAGDTMLGRNVASALETVAPQELVSPALADAVREADLFVLNLECCISDRGRAWPGPDKSFFFRAPPAAVDVLRHLGVSCVTLANNHALDFGEQALLDTREHLDKAGIAAVGAGADVDAARRPATLTANGFRLRIIGVTDHPDDFAAYAERPGVAYANLSEGVPGWLTDAVRTHDVDAVLVTPHWGPNMMPSPLPYIRHAASALRDAGATLIAGHSAHVFQGIEAAALGGRTVATIFDLGDFLDDYAVDPVLRNDLGLLTFVVLDEEGVVRIEAIPLRLEDSFTRLADGEDAGWIRRRFRSVCSELGTAVREEAGRLVVDCR